MAKTKITNPVNKATAIPDDDAPEVKATEIVDEEEDEGEDLPETKPTPPAAKKPPEVKAMKKPVSKSHAEILAQITKESDARVNFDNFLNDDDRKGNMYDIPAHLVPDGFTIEMKNTHVRGVPVPESELAALEMAGWRPCPAELLREMLPEGYDKPTYEIGGMIAMIRPAKTTEKFRRKELANARGALANKVKELTNTKEGEMDRVVKTHSVTREARIAGDDE